jgi:5-methylcytosine-specific restriction endonuclease McrA
VVEYRSYIASPEWRAKREEMKRRSKRGYSCAPCGATDRLDLHHRTYKRLGNERLSDLMWLCRPCHDAVHAIVRDWKASGANPSKRNLWTAARELRKRRLRVAAA